MILNAKSVDAKVYLIAAYISYVKISDYSINFRCSFALAYNYISVFFVQAKT